MKLTIILISDNIEDNMTIKINPEDTLKIKYGSMIVYDENKNPFVIVKYNSEDKTWCGYNKTFKEILFK